MSNGDERLTDQQLDAISTKIKKLIALRDHRSASVGEAGNAAAAIQRLLAEYNLTLHEVESRAGSKRPRSEYGKFELDLGTTSGYRSEWKSHLLVVICETNWCRPLLYPRGRYYNPETHRHEQRNARMILIGKEHNVRVVRELYEWLAPELNRIRIQHWQRHLKDGGQQSEDHRFAYSFLIGAVQEIRTRLWAERRKQEAEVGQSMTALVVRTDQELAEAMKQFFPEVTYSKVKRRTIDVEAMLQGQQVGRNISLHRPRPLGSGPGKLAS